MATAFSETETQLIKEKLKASAKACLLRYGIRKTSIDQLVADASISKGSFYKFYPSKELLFFETLNDLHDEVYNLAENILKSRTDLEPADRIAETLLSCFNLVCTYLPEDFLETEMDYLIRKLPPEVMPLHLISEGQDIKNLIERCNLKFNQSPEVISGIIHTLFFTISHRKSIGPTYDSALRILIKGASCQLLDEQN